MKLTLAIVGPSLIKPASDREKAARQTELANALKVVADSIANTGARDGKIQNRTFSGNFFIEG